MRTSQRRLVPVALLSRPLTLAAACGSSSKPSSTGNTGRDSGQAHPAPRLPPERHAHAGDHRPAETASSPKTSAPTSTLKTSTYNSGTDETTALLAGALDAAFVGPNPAINAYQKTERHADPHRRRHRVGRCVPRGQALDQDRGRPQGQEARDAVARQHPRRRAAHLAQVEGPRPRPPAAATCRSSPRTTPRPSPRSRPARSSARGYREPYASQLEQHGGKVMVNEASLWPKGRFVTTNLIVTTKYLNAHPDGHPNLLKGLSELHRPDQERPHPGRAARVGPESAPPPARRSRSRSSKDSFADITFTLDPIASSFKKDAASREGARLHQVDGPDQHLRPHPVEQAARFAGEAGDHSVKPRSARAASRDSMPASARRRRLRRRFRSPTCRSLSAVGPRHGSSRSKA